MRILRDIAGIFACIVLLGAAGNLDYAAALTTEAMEKESRPARVMLERDALDCLRVRDGLPLRHCVKHCPDGTPFGRWCRIEEFYGAVERRDVM